MFSYRRLNCGTGLYVGSQPSLFEEPRARGYEQNTSDQLGFGPRARHFLLAALSMLNAQHRRHLIRRVGWDGKTWASQQHVRVGCKAVTAA